MGVSMAKGLLWPLAALGFAVLAGCAGTAPGPGCGIVYTIGEPEVAQAIARGQNVTKPGPLPAHVVPRSAPRPALEPDGSYEARTAAVELTAKGILPKDRPWRVYEVAASWDKDVYEKRPGEYRLKHPARMTQVAN